MSESFSTDLAAASQAALTDLQSSTAPAAPAADQVAPEAPAAAVEAPTAEASTSTETPAPEAQAQVDTQAPAAPEEDKATQKWVIERKGQQVEITDPKQVQDLIRQGYDYTQKTMELAEQRRQVEAQLAQAREWLANPANVKAYLQQLEAANPAPPAPAPVDPDSLVTAAEAQAQIAAAAEQAQRQMAQQAQSIVQNALLQAETARYYQDYKAQTDATLHSLINEKFPILQDVEKVDRLILDDVAEKIKARQLLDPNHVATIDEAKSLMVEIASRRADKLNARVREHVKMETVRAAKVKASTPEPAGGGAPAPTPAPSFKLGSRELTQSVVAELQAAFDKKS